MGLLGVGLLIVIIVGSIIALNVRENKILMIIVLIVVAIALTVRIGFQIAGIKEVTKQCIYHISM